MTVNTATCSQRFHGSGGVGPFTWAWRFLANTDIGVYRINSPNESEPALEVRELLTVGDYTLSGAGSYQGGGLTLAVPLETGQDVIVERFTSPLQEVSIRQQGNNFRPEIHEDVFDRLTMMVQDRDRITIQNAADSATIKPIVTDAVADIAAHEGRISALESDVGTISAEVAALEAGLPTGALSDFTANLKVNTVSTVRGPIDASAYGTLELADAAAMLGGRQLVISGVYAAVPSTLSAPSVKVMPGGVLNVTGTLTITGSFEGCKGCFTGAGAVLGLRYVEDDWFPTAQLGLNAAAGGVFKVLHDRTETAAWVIPKYTVVEGTGKAGARVTFMHEGNGLFSSWPVNGSTGAYVTVKDLSIRCINDANTGGGFVDVAGTFIHVYNCLIQGFKYGIILDQTELSEVELCDVELPLLAGMWLLNGDQHSVGAAGGFTNRITVSRCQFGGAVGTYGVLDDGGNAHAFRDNNFNGCTTHMRMAGVIGLDIKGGEFESASSDLIVFSSTAYTGEGSGPCTGVSIGGGIELVPNTTTNPHCIMIYSAATIAFNSVFLGNTTAAKIAGAVNCSYIFAANLSNGGGGAIFDSAATVHYDFSSATATLPGIVLTGRIKEKLVNLVYGATVAVDAALGNYYTLAVTNNSAFTIATPTNPTQGQQITLCIYNSSGGAMGSITWGSAAAYRMAAWTNPVNGYITSVTFRYSGSNWVQTAAAVTVPQ